MVNAATQGDFSARLGLTGKTGFLAKISEGMCERGLNERRAGGGKGLVSGGRG